MSLCQATPSQKAQEVTCWLLQAYEELLEGWDSTEGESYAERYHVCVTEVFISLGPACAPKQCFF